MKKKTKKSQLVKIVTAVLITGFIFSFVLANNLYRKILKTNIKFGDGIEERYIFIESDSKFSDVLLLLESNNLLLDINSFKWVAEKKNYINNIKPGRYFIDRDMNNNDLVNLLRSGKQSPVKVTFNNVRNLENVSSKLSQYLEADSNEIYNAFIDVDFLKKKSIG